MAPHHVRNDKPPFRNRKRPYSGGYGSISNKYYKKDDPPEKTLRKPSGDLIQVLSEADLEPVGNSFRVENTDYVASYNWLDRKEPTIVVPGSPPVIQMTSAHQSQLERNQDSEFLDPNSAKCPESPFDPAVRAISHAHPTFETSSIDVVACNKTLGYLFSFADGIYCSFRFDVQLLGTTLFLTRREHPPAKTYYPIGYSQSFARRRTYWEDDVKGSISHQRIMKYRMGNLDVLMRYEVDGHFIDEKVEVVCKKSEEDGDSRDKTTREVTEMNIDASPAIGRSVKLETDPQREASPKLEEDLKLEEDVKLEKHSSITMTPEKADSTLSSTNPPTQTRISAHSFSAVPTVNIVLQIGGKAIEQTSLAEIKTRSHSNPLDQDEANRRAWLKQVPNLVVGYHENGAFGDPEVQSMTQRTNAWEEKNSRSIGKLIDVLGKLKECVLKVCQEEDKPMGTVEVLRRGGDVLEIRRMHEDDKGRSALSGEMKKLWIDGNVS